MTSLSAARTACFNWDLRAEDGDGEECSASCLDWEEVRTADETERRRELLFGDGEGNADPPEDEVGDEIGI